MKKIVILNAVLPKYFLKQNSTHMHNDGTISNLNIEFTNTNK